VGGFSRQRRGKTTGKAPNLKDNATAGEEGSGCFATSEGVISGDAMGVMTKLSIKGNWNELKGKLKQKYASLTDDDLTFAEGKEEELLGRLQKRLGKSKEDVRNELGAL
jgi:uncharacterized protein YjbJ (UPF0337 family)